MVGGQWLWSAVVVVSGQWLWSVVVIVVSGRGQPPCSTPVGLPCARCCCRLPCSVSVVGVCGQWSAAVVSGRGQLRSVGSRVRLWALLPAAHPSETLLCPLMSSHTARSSGSRRCRPGGWGSPVNHTGHAPLIGINSTPVISMTAAR